MRGGGGGGGVTSEGGKTAGLSGGSGCSNCGGMSESGSCLTSSARKSCTASGMREVSKRKRPSSKSVVKSLVTSSLSCRQHLTRSASASVSGRWWCSVMSGSSASSGSITTDSSPVSHLSSTSISLPFSSLSSLRVSTTAVAHGGTA